MVPCSTDEAACAVVVAFQEDGGDDGACKALSKGHWDHTGTSYDQLLLCLALPSESQEALLGTPASYPLVQGIVNDVLATSIG